MGDTRDSHRGCISGSPSAEEDVNRLLESVNQWAGSSELDDDTTIVSLGIIKTH
jgi:hypothetical protein